MKTIIYAYFIVTVKRGLVLCRFIFLMGENLLQWKEMKGEREKAKINKSKQVKHVINKINTRVDEDDN